MDATRIRQLLDDTGYMIGDAFADADEVRAYFTTENMATMFCPDEKHAKLTQADLNELAEYAIANRVHMAAESCYAVSPTLSVHCVEVINQTALSDNVQVQATDDGGQWWTTRDCLYETMEQAEEVVAKARTEAE